MLTVYRRGETGLEAAGDPAEALRDGSAVWADLLHPSEAEEHLVEGALNIDAPTEAERAMLEQSARFYEENGALVLTATLVARHAEHAEAAGVSFILARNALVTVRTIEPSAFRVGQGRASARIDGAHDGGEVLIALLEGVIERLADVLQECRARAQKLSEQIFGPARFGAADMRPALTELSRLGAIIAMARESLGTLERLFAYAGHVCAAYGLPGERLIALTRDAQHLERTGDALQDHVIFLLDAALGLVAANQNVAIQRLTAAATIFVPSTLIASIFGMNFEAMSWFKAPWGPWLAFALMGAASLAVLAFARWRKWF
ncbi:MAG: CorA family divalent cation transporter [Hyphomonadaceae bacterium]